jgi:hypothetical protein
MMSEPSAQECPRCGGRMTPAEAACYRNVCEACWVAAIPGPGADKRLYDPKIGSMMRLHSPPGCGEGRDFGGNHT